MTRNRFSPIAAFILCCALLISGCTAAPAQEPASTSATTPAWLPPQTDAPPSTTQNPVDMQQALNDMTPVLDSITRAMGVLGRVPYAPDDPEFFWAVLYLMSESWGDTHPLVKREDDGTVVMPGQVMQEFAAAAFYGCDALPALPASHSAAIDYDQDYDIYRIAPSDGIDAEIVLRGYYVKDDGTINAMMYLSSPDDDIQPGTLMFSLAVNPYANDADTAYCYSVTGVESITGDSDLWRAADAMQPITADLNGDGIEETIAVVVDEEQYTTTVTVTSGDTVLTDVSDSALFGPICHIGDVTAGDGAKELYICGDIASDDYVTYIYRIQNGTLQRAEIFGTVMFADGGGTLPVITVVNVLGSYAGYCQYALGDDFTFTLSSPYAVLRYIGDWEDRKLTVAKDGISAIPVASTTSATIPLSKGEELMLAETDEMNYVILERRDGSQLLVNVEKNEEEWGWLINGIPEEEWFGMLMYAG